MFHMLWWLESAGDVSRLQ